ncbi:flagellar hook-associated protein 3 [Gammaproteobacteria bacterium 45_16_T64]|nr:flagellar hook-associated protein 3 [Gammaproteobacteria bacterium 45_16_T64]
MRVSTSHVYNTGLNSMLDQQTKLSTTQLQLAAGKRIIKPSDDPIGSGIALSIKQLIQTSEQFVSNGQTGQTKLEVVESSLASVTDILNRSRDLVLQGSNGTLSGQDRRSLALEIESRLQELVSLANTQTASGDYIFSGFATNVAPYTRDIAGNFIYNGDQGKQFVDVNSSLEVQTNFSGSELFSDVPTGNGTFQTLGSSSNQGTGVISGGSVLDNSAYVPDTYTVTFLNNASGVLSYQVDGATTGQLIPALPGVPLTDAPRYVEGANIEFGGIQFSISGIPQVGDTFTVESSNSQDIFTTLQQVIDGLRSSDASPTLQAQMADQLNNGLINLDQALGHIDEGRSAVGTRLNVIESEQSINANIIVQAESSLSLVEDLDYASAITDLNKQSVALQAAQQSFVQIQGLSLFQFIR